MATFVSLTYEGTSGTIHVNMDKVIKMERFQDKYTAITFEPPQIGLTVRETPSQIMDMIHHERKGLVVPG
jgi:hypothetical protein